MAITTNTEYKTWAKITGSADDAVITILISSASRMAERLCGRTLTTSGATSFESGTYTEVFNGNGCESVQLSNTPIASITSVTLLAGDGSTLNTFDATDFKFNPTTGELALTPVYRGRLARVGPDGWYSDSAMGDTWSSPAFPDQFRNVSVVYVGGYSTVPDDLKMAIWRLVDLFMATRGQDPTVKSESIGVRSITYADASKTGSVTDEQARAVLGTLARGIP